MNRFFKIALRLILGLIAFVLIVFTILYLVYNEPVPKGTQSKEADALAQKMLVAINYEAYKQTRFLEWSFSGGSHTYKWDKKNGKVDVKWSDYLVKLNLNNPNKSKVYDTSAEVIGENKSELIKKATDYFNNDSFWLVAPFKVFDNGTTRSLVNLKDGTSGLLVSYTSGGTTPGDSYLWKLQPNGFPISYQMWVEIIPIGGLEATWDEWKVMENGVFLPSSHKLGPMTLDLGTVRAYN